MFQWDVCMLHISARADTIKKKTSGVSVMPKGMPLLVKWLTEVLKPAKIIATIRTNTILLSRDDGAPLMISTLLRLVPR